MPLIVRDLPTLTPTSSGSANSNASGFLDDANSITIMISSGVATTGNFTVQVSQFDPFTTTPVTGTAQSTFFYNYAPTSTGGKLSLCSSWEPLNSTPNTSFPGFPLSELSNWNGTVYSPFL